MNTSTKNQTYDKVIDWPGWDHLRYCYLIELLVLLLFVIVYGGTDYLIGLHDYRVRIHFDWELEIPLIVWISTIYMSINFVWPIAPLIIRRREEVQFLVRVIVISIIISGIIFLIVPAAPAYKEPLLEEIYGWEFWYKSASAVNLTYNSFPSLHVALVLALTNSLIRNKNPMFKIICWIWAFFVAISTVLAHQHHVIDIFGGIIVFWVASKLVKKYQSNKYSTT